MTYQAKQYAHALFGLVSSKDDFERAISVLKSFKRAYEKDSAIRHFFDNPNLAFSQKKELIMKSLAGDSSAPASAPTAVTNLLLLMAENIELFKLSKTIYILKKIGDQHFDVLEIRVTTPIALSDNLKRMLETKFREHEGQTVLIREKIDDQMVGGLMIKVHDKLFDASITHTLEHLLTQVA